VGRILFVVGIAGLFLAMAWTLWWHERWQEREREAAGARMMRPPPPSSY
jgi:hypothetical protein